MPKPKSEHKNEGQAQGISKEEQEKLRESLARLCDYINNDIIGRGKNGKKPKGLECIIKGTVTRTKKVDSGLCRRCGDNVNSTRRHREKK